MFSMAIEMPLSENNDIFTAFTLKYGIFYVAAFFDISIFGEGKYSENLRRVRRKFSSELLLLYIYANICTVTTQNGINIKQILSDIPSGTVITAKKLASLGVSHSLMRSYERSGWLRRISAGAYTKLNETTDLNGAIYALQNDCGLAVHEGAHSALKNFYSKMHYAKDEKIIHLFASSGTKLPAWFKSVFSDEYELHLTNFLPPDVGMTERSEEAFSVKVPTLERTLLEMLYLVPEKITVQEAYSVTETVMSVKTPLMQNLLENCNSVKVKRLLLFSAY